MYAEILIEYNNKTIDKTFTYLIPKTLENKIKVGMQVRVPFNKKLINGFVLKIYVYLYKKSTIFLVPLHIFHYIFHYNSL